MRAIRPALPAYAALSVTDAFLAARGRRRLRLLTKPLLMPVLALALDQPDPVVLAGIGLSGLGDIALLAEGDGPFALGLASFLAAHVCYLVALRNKRGGGVRRSRRLAGAYGLAWVGLNALLLPRTGKLRVPVLIYGTALVSMALAALDTADAVTTAGGAAFLVSDSVLALDAFGVARLPGADAVVMLTYTAAQGLLAAGLTP